MRHNLIPIWVAILVFVIVTAVWICLGFLPAFNQVPFFDFTRDGEFDPILPGIFGDSFGWITSLFSALAFAGVLLTLWIQHYELRLQREEMKRVAKVQEEAERREALATYMNALESLRQLSEWRMTNDPATTKRAYPPVVHGLVIQARVIQSLHTLVNDLEPDIRKLYPSLKAVSKEGSKVWQLERLFNIYSSIQEIVESRRGNCDNMSSFNEAVDMAKEQFDKLKSMKAYCNSCWYRTIDGVLSKASTPDKSTEEKRKHYFAELQEASKQLLSLIMSMCYE